MAVHSLTHSLFFLSVRNNWLWNILYGQGITQPHLTGQDDLMKVPLWNSSKAN